MNEKPIADFLPLAENIAREFSNIPGLGAAEIEMRAQEALAAAARSFDPTRGTFAPYAAAAIRNALRSLYESQVRHHAHHDYRLDDTRAWGDSTATRPVQNLADPSGESVTLQARAGETRSILQQVMACVAPRSRLVLERIAAGSSYSEIGSELGISKQAAHKLAHAAMQTLREALASRGYGGLDSVGLLKSCSGVFAPAEKHLPTPLDD